ncbi:MAG: outer membrane beta-barrel protein, partial [Burkholderiaceae bacterium]
AFGAVVCLGLLSGVAHAADQSGVYIGVGGGIAASNVVEQGFTYSSTTKKDTTTSGIKVFGGYSWGMWGVEVGQYEFGKYSIAGVSGGSSEDEYRLSASAIAAAGNFPLGKTLDLTARLGIASAAVKYHCVTLCAGLPDRSTTSTVPVFGVGLKWNVLENVGLRVDFDGIGGASSKFGTNERKVNASLLSVGIQATF